MTAGDSASASTFRPTASAAAGVRPGADAAEALAFDRLVEPQRAAPEDLVPERVEAKDAPALLEQIGGVLHDLRVERVRAAMGGAAIGTAILHGKRGRARQRLPRTARLS